MASSLENRRDTVCDPPGRTLGAFSGRVRVPQGPAQGAESNITPPNSGSIAGGAARSNNTLLVNSSSTKQQRAMTGQFSGSLSPRGGISSKLGLSDGGTSSLSSSFENLDKKFERLNALLFGEDGSNSARGSTFSQSRSDGPKPGLVDSSSHAIPQRPRPRTQVGGGRLVGGRGGTDSVLSFATQASSETGSSLSNLKLPLVKPVYVPPATASSPAKRKKSSTSKKHRKSPEKEKNEEQESSSLKAEEGGAGDDGEETNTTSTLTKTESRSATPLATNNTANIKKAKKGTEEEEEVSKKVEFIDSTLGKNGVHDDDDLVYAVVRKEDLIMTHLEKRRGGPSAGTVVANTVLTNTLPRDAGLRDFYGPTTVEEAIEMDYQPPEPYDFSASSSLDNPHDQNFAEVSMISSSHISAMRTRLATTTGGGGNYSRFSMSQSLPRPPNSRGGVGGGSFNQLTSSFMTAGVSPPMAGREKPVYERLFDQRKVPKEFSHKPLICEFGNNRGDMRRGIQSKIAEVRDSGEIGQRAFQKECNDWAREKSDKIYQRFGKRLQEVHDGKVPAPPSGSNFVKRRDAVQERRNVQLTQNVMNPAPTVVIPVQHCSGKSDSLLLRRWLVLITLPKLFELSVGTVVRDRFRDHRRIKKAPLGLIMSIASEFEQQQRYVKAVAVIESCALLWAINRRVRRKRAANAVIHHFLKMRHYVASIRKRIRTLRAEVVICQAFARNFLFRRRARLNRWLVHWRGVEENFRDQWPFDPTLMEMKSHPTSEDTLVELYLAPLHQKLTHNYLTSFREYVSRLKVHVQTVRTRQQQNKVVSSSTTATGAPRTTATSNSSSVGGDDANIQQDSYSTPTDLSEVNSTAVYSSTNVSQMATAVVTSLAANDPTAPAPPPPFLKPIAQRDLIPLIRREMERRQAKEKQQQSTTVSGNKEENTSSQPESNKAPVSTTAAAKSTVELGSILTSGGRELQKEADPMGQGRNNHPNKPQQQQQQQQQQHHRPSRSSEVRIVGEEDDGVKGGGNDALLSSDESSHANTASGAEGQRASTPPLPMEGSTLSI